MQGRRRACPASRRRSQAGEGGGGSATQGQARRSARRLYALQSDARSRRLGDHRYLSLAKGILDRRHTGALPFAMAHRTGLQALEERDRPQGTARVRRALRQVLYSGPFADDSFARAVRRRTRGLSPRARRRLTRPGAWRVLRQLVACFLQAVFPAPTFALLRRRKAALARHLHEPPRRRAYQRFARTF